MYYVSRAIGLIAGTNGHVVITKGEPRSGSSLGMVIYNDQGEGEAYSDPRAASRAAMRVLEAWQNDLVAILTPDATKPLGTWAEDEYQSLPKCSWCSAIIEGHPTVLFDVDNVAFCGPSCSGQYERNNKHAWCDRCDHDVEATHALDEEEMEMFLCSHCAGSFELGQCYPKAALKVLG